MKNSIKFACVIALALMLLAFAKSRQAGAEKVARRIPNKSVTLPLAFVPNAGQTDARVRYFAQTTGASFYFTDREAVFAFHREKKVHALRLSFLGANQAPQIEGAQLEIGKVNYLIGNDRAQWRTDVPTYGEVVYRDLWPGIDLAFRNQKGTLKYEFRVAPGADAGRIRL